MTIKENPIDDWIHEVMSAKQDFYIEDPVVVAVMRKMEARSQQGMQTYGKSMQEATMSRMEWLLNAQEELLDTALYLQKLIDMELIND